MMVSHIVLAARLAKTRYATRDPYTLCRAMDILLLFESMGKGPGCCKGFIFKHSRVSCITLNSDLPEELQRIVLAHELGHYILHKEKIGIRPYHDVELFDETSTEEYQANVFAAEFLMSDAAVLEYINEDISFFGVARALSVPPELLDFKWRLMKRDGFVFADSPITATGDFMKSLEQHCDAAGDQEIRF